MKRFIVKDMYDFDETLIETDDLIEAYEAALTRMADTDGECYVEIRDMQTASFPGSASVSIDFYGED